MLPFSGNLKSLILKTVDFIGISNLKIAINAGNIAAVGHKE
jgi:hypothetical protein